MSYRIRDQIAKLKGIPAKHKRVLDAWASFADPDGTNIRPSKKAVAERAGINRATVYRNTDDLVEVGILVDTGNKHFYGAGHYTTVYRIDIAMLQNATLLGEKLCCKMLHRQCCKMSKTNVAKCDATIPLDPAPKPQARKEGKKAASLATLATPTVVPAEASAEPSPEAQTLALVWFKHTGCEFVPDDYARAQSLVDTEEQGSGRVEQVLYNTLCERPKSSGMDWTDFRVFADNYDLNRRKAIAWDRKMKAKSRAGDCPPAPAPPPNGRAAFEIEEDLDDDHVELPARAAFEIEEDLG